MSTNGNDSGGVAHLEAQVAHYAEELIAHHKAVILSLQTSLNLLRGGAPKLHPDADPAVDQSARRKPRKRQPRADAMSKRQELRTKTAQNLAEYSETDPQPLHVGHHALVKGGFLKAKGDGYVRTGKEYVV